MQAKYQPFFSINIRHEYFHDGKCRVIKLAPTDSTAQMMQQLGLRIVDRDGHYEVYYDTLAGHPASILNYNEDFVLDFRLVLSDHLFYNYTDLKPFNIQQEGWLSVHKAGTDDFSINPVSEGVVDKVAPSSEDVEEDVIILTDGIQDSDFGLLSIEFPLAGGVAEDWIDENNIPAITLSFAKRSTIWRYFIISTSGDLVPGSASITGEATFNLLPEKQQLPNGSEAIVMESSEPLALHDRYAQNPVLNIDQLKNGAPVSMEIPLPNADPNTISAKTPGELPSSTGGFYSKLYVYL